MVLLLFWLLSAAPVMAQVLPGAHAPTAAPPSATEPPRAEIEARRAALVEELHEFEDRLQAGLAGAEPDLSKAVRALQNTDLLYAQQLAALQQKEDLTEQRDRTAAELAELQSKGLGEKGPFNIVLIDDRRDQLDAETGRNADLEAGIRAAQDAVEQARKNADEAERERRQAKEALEANSDPAAAAALQGTLRLRQLQSRAAAERVKLREFELANELLTREIQQLRVALLTRKLELMTQSICFTDGDLQQQLERVEKEAVALNQALDTATIDLESSERQWMKARARLEKNPGDPLVADETEARRLARQARQQEVMLLGQRLQQIGDVKLAWQRRHAILNRKASRAELAAWEGEVERAIEQLEREERVDQTRISELRNEAAALSERVLAAVEANPERARWLKEQEKRAQERLRAFEAAARDRSALLRLQRNLHKEIVARRASFNVGERLAGLWEQRGLVWRYELFSINDASISVGKIVTGLLLFAIGMGVARLLSRWLGQRLFPRLGLDAGASAALQSLSFYLLVTLLTLFALRVINIPLTAFTIAGGALAIGVGFGSQNIVNNFISGLILLVERPIKVGDVIEIDGTQGTVERIGPRSTRIKQSTNIHMVVPNSAFLEKNVVNWTLSDDVVRSRVQVGVAYGSPTREVTRLLRQAVRQHGKVLPSPEPLVLFDSFGDNALVFEVHFWIRIHSSFEERVIDSDIRFTIEHLFREAGLVMAFPQRDVHIDAAAPIPVRITGGGHAAAEADEPPHGTEPAAGKGTA